MVNVDSLLYGSATVAGLDVGEEEGPEREWSGSDGEDEGESDEESDEEVAVHEASGVNFFIDPPFHRPAVS
jgi:hypothetical protein